MLRYTSIPGEETHEVRDVSSSIFEPASAARLDLASLTHISETGPWSPTPAAALDPAADREQWDKEYLPWYKLSLKVVISIIVGLSIMVLLERYAEKTVANLSGSLMDRIGLPGLSLTVFLLDCLPQPFPWAPLVYMAVKGSVAKTSVFWVCFLSSYIAALTGYAIGLKLRGLERGSTLFQQFARSYPYIPVLMERRGALGVALAAMLPMPFAIATWTAGSFQMQFHQFALASACRMPKILCLILLSPAPATQSVQLTS